MTQNSTAAQGNGKRHVVTSTTASDSATFGTIYSSEALCGKTVPHLMPAAPGVVTCGACAKKL